MIKFFQGSADTQNVLGVG